MTALKLYKVNKRAIRRNHRIARLASQLTLAPASNNISYV